MSLVQGSRAQKAGLVFAPVIPKTWDEEALRSLEVPLPDPKFSPVAVPVEYYYRMPVRPIYRSYPIYATGKEPANYFEWLKRQEPEVLWGSARPRLETEADWIEAAEIVFDAPIILR
jgi:hypothetical protein